MSRFWKKTLDRMETLTYKLSEFVGLRSKGGYLKLPTKALYAARAILDLSMHTGEGLIQLKEIAKRQDVSEPYLEQLMIPLRRAGLIVSVRGAKGGHQLAKHPSEITLADVVEATEGSVSFVECVDDQSACSRSSACALRKAWQQSVETLNACLSSLSFQKLAEEQMHLVSEETTMYYI